MFEKLLKLFHTVKFLRFKQIFYRIYYRLVNRQPAVPNHVVVREWALPWSSPSWQKPSLLRDHEFEFLNEKGEVRNSSDWNHPEKTKIWLYNLHYLDDLNAREHQLRFESHEWLISSWIEGNPPFKGNGWEPYVVSLRAVNLIKFYARTANVPDEWNSSLALQLLKLSTQIEYHILGNHLFANAKALVFAGAYFDQASGQKFLNTGLKILDAEIKEQFLPDGGHFELSPMYHATLLWDLCDLINLADRSGLEALTRRRNEWKNTLEKGLIWLKGMIHPDGEVAFFNDACFEIAPTFENLKAYAQTLGCNLGTFPNPTHQHFKASGFIVINPGLRDKVFIDVGEVGPTYQPGHAHADTLSFELSLYGQRVFVNSGTSQYGLGPKREFQRSTKAHNTISLDDQNSSEVWSGFRVARRAKPQDLKLSEEKGTVFVACSHDGFTRFNKMNLHNRQWMVSSGEMQITDKLSGEFKEAVAYFYLHPNMKITRVEGNMVDLELPEGQSIKLSFHGAKNIAIMDSVWNPKFGVSTPNKCFTVKIKDKLLQTEMKW